MIGTLTRTLGAAVAAALLCAACSSAPCEEAADRLEQCLERLDCRGVDPLDLRKCTSAETDGQEAVEQLRSLPCTAQLRDKADEINSCPIDQVAYCNCWAI